MNLPNKLTIGRIVATLFLIVFLLFDAPLFRWGSFILFVLAGVTDLLDGYIARRNHLVTALGKFMDPLADKILNYSVMVLLIPEGLVPAMTIVLILIREFLVSGIRQTAVEQGTVIAANVFGKVKTIFQDVSLGVILFFRIFDMPFLTPLSVALMWISAVLTVASGVVYLIQNIGVFKGQ